MITNNKEGVLHLEKNTEKDEGYFCHQHQEWIFNSVLTEN